MVTGIRPTGLTGTPAAPADALSTPGMRRARLCILAGAASGVAACVLLAALELRREPDPRGIVLGAAGSLLLVLALAAALHRSVMPWRATTTGRWLVAGCATAAVLSVPLVGPVGGTPGRAWAFVGAALVGAAPLLLPVRCAVTLMAGTVLVAAATAWWLGGPVRDAVTVTVVLGLTVATWNVLHLWFWTFRAQAREGHDALARLAAAEERLRCARDVYALLANELSALVLKAELASRLAMVDGERTRKETAEMRALAAAASARMREAVHGYRSVGLREQAQTVARVLRNAGVRCSVTQPERDLPPALTGPLVSVLREAGAHVLRHGEARWCTIEIAGEASGARLTVVNDGAGDGAPDLDGSGLPGLADRLRDAGGTLRTWRGDGTFTVQASVRAGS
ncbi:sensor histidine kinase [Micromonospora sp. DT46]|uniref:sensor histidine kinase n=1 Tax=unclassified Micromonospora TaxID=2617518 RepID=UPI001CEDE165|nr:MULTISPECIES: histidine kinase [unclassified Micromonospora]WSG05441.1 histidine kinase [Micromonospora sp. NBC_01740]